MLCLSVLWWCSDAVGLEMTGSDPTLLRSLLDSVLPELPACLVLVLPARHTSHLDLLPGYVVTLRVNVASPDLHLVLLASYKMKCYGYVTDEEAAEGMLVALGEAREEAQERHTPRVLVLPSPAASRKYPPCPAFFSLPETRHIADFLLVSSANGEESFNLYTNAFIGNAEDGKENCSVFGAWPSNNLKFYPDKTANLQGKEVVAATLDYPPYSMLDPNFDGMETRFVKEFCKRYNCTITLLTDSDLWGEIFGNGSGNGLSGAVYMDRAELGFGAVYAWEYEHHYVDYSQTYLGTKVTVLVPRPARLAEWRIPILPFPPTMWALQLVSIAAAAIVLALVNWAAASLLHSGWLGGEFSTLGGIALRALAMALLQPPPSRLPASSPLRRFFTIFEVLFLFFTTIYSGALSSVLTVPMFYPPIDSPEELFEAGIPWAADHEAWVYSLKGATEPHLRGLVRRFETHETEELVRLAKKGGYGFSIEIMAAGHITQMKHLSGEMILRLHVMKTELYTSSPVFIFRKGSPYTEKVNKLLGQCVDTGLMLLWETDVTLTYLSSRLQTALEISEGSRVEVHEPTTLKILHVQGAFILLVLGLAISTIVFLAERLGHPADQLPL